MYAIASWLYILPCALKLYDGWVNASEYKGPNQYTKYLNCAYLIVYYEKLFVQVKITHNYWSHNVNEFSQSGSLI